MYSRPRYKLNNMMTISNISAPEVLIPLPWQDGESEKGDPLPTSNSGFDYSKSCNRICKIIRSIGIKGILYSLFFIAVLLLFVACSSSWSPSNDQAAKLVEEYYLFSHGGQRVKASVVERGEYIKKCDCYPIKFKLIFSKRNNNMTFYFHKNESGKVAVRKSMR